MEAWSHSPVKDFKTRFFLDTNILCFLIDDTYPSLSKFIICFQNSPLVELISSEYVLLEFISVRKKEHYLRETIYQTQGQGKQINMSSVLKGHERYSVREIEFNSLLPNIKTNVDFEKEKISSNFGITFNCGFHRDLFNPTSDICLSSKISKEDSLVLISSIYPQQGSVNENVILFTNDDDFKIWFSEVSIENILGQYNISKPEMQGLNNINATKSLNLFHTIADNEIEQHYIDYIKKILITRLTNLFIGETFAPRSNLPVDCICFEAIVDKRIMNNKYLTIIGKKLDFVYNTEYQLSFWNNGGEIPSEGFIPTNGNNYLSFRILIDDENEYKNDILAKIKEPGNLIFLHPDN